MAERNKYYSVILPTQCEDVTLSYAAHVVCSVSGELYTNS